MSAVKNRGERRAARAREINRNSRIFSTLPVRDREYDHARDAYWLGRGRKYSKGNRKSTERWTGIDPIPARAAINAGLNDWIDENIAQGDANS